MQHHLLTASFKSFPYCINISPAPLGVILWRRLGDVTWQMVRSQRLWDHILWNCASFLSGTFTSHYQYSFQAKACWVQVSLHSPSSHVSPAWNPYLWKLQNMIILHCHICHLQENLIRRFISAKLYSRTILLLNLTQRTLRDITTRILKRFSTHGNVVMWARCAYVNTKMLPPGLRIAAKLTTQHGNIISFKR